MTFISNNATITTATAITTTGSLCQQPQQRRQSSSSSSTRRSHRTATTRISSSSNSISTVGSCSMILRRTLLLATILVSNAARVFSDDGDPLSQFKLPSFSLDFITPPPEVTTGDDNIPLAYFNAAPFHRVLTKTLEEKLAVETSDFSYILIGDAVSIDFNIIGDDPSRHRRTATRSNIRGQEEQRPPHRTLQDTPEDGDISTSVTFGTGIVTFSEDRPNADGIMELLKEVVEAKLISNLNSDPTTMDGPLTGAGSVTFQDLTPTDAPTDAPVPEDTEDNDRTTAGATGATTSILVPQEQSTVRKVLGSMAGFAMLIIGGAMLISSHRRSTRAEQHGHTLQLAEEMEGNTESFSKSQMASNELGKAVDDVVTIPEDDADQEDYDDDDEFDDAATDTTRMAKYYSTESTASNVESVSVISEFTLSTDTGVSLSPGSTNSRKKKGISRRSFQHDAWATSEAFERDRQVTIQKDMLQSEWTMTDPHHAHQQYQQQDQQQQEEEYDSTLADNDKMIFSQAHDTGEEVYLVPPSKTVGRRL